MKKILNPENLFCISALPMLYFLVSRISTFFFDAWEIVLNKSIVVCIFLLAEALIIIFRRHIEKYLKLGNNKLAFLISAFCVCFFKSVFLRGCNGANTFLCVIGAIVLFGIFLSLLFKNLLYFFAKIKVSKKDIIFLGAVFLLLNFEAFLYCANMRQIFVWDNAGYFTTVHKLNDIFPKAEYFKSVYNSIFETDYNYVIMLPASIMCKIFGKSRLVFVLSIINFYLYPLFLLIYYFGKHFFNNGVIKTVCVYLCLPYLVFAANTGFIDIGGIIPVLLATILYLYCNRDKSSILIGVFLAIAVYMRRWYSFFALSFVITVFISSIPKKNFKTFFEILGSFAFVLLLFTQDFVSTKLLADYKYMYSAYALGVKTDVMIFTRYFGVIMTLVLILYAVIRAKRTRNEIFMLIQAVLNFLLFVSVQTHGQQHLALYVPAFVVLMTSLVSYVKKKQGIIVLAILSCIQTVNTFVPRVQPTSIGEIKKAALVPDFSIYPKIDKSAEDILKITEFMDTQIGEEGKTVSLLASSLKLNYDTLNNAEVSLSVERKSSINRESYFYPISEVDKRDGLAHTLFKADYLLIPSELQIHLEENEQRVISIPYDKVIQSIGFGSAYIKEDISFKLFDGTEIYLYKRVRDIESFEIETIYKEIFN